MKSIFVSLVLACLTVLISGCVTETTGPVREADPEKQLNALIKLGNGYIRNGEYTRAKENLNLALTLDPRSPQVHTAFARLFQLEGETKLSEQHFKKAISAASNYSPARNNYGVFLFAEGRYEEAVKQLSVAAEDRFYHLRPQVFENLGVSYLQLDKITEAENAFERSIRLNPTQSRALIEVAEIRFNQLNYVESRMFYRRHMNASQPSARSLWLCIRLARIFEAQDQEASCALTLRNVFPGTAEFRRYQSTIAQ